jgi:uridylate kinase
LYDQYEKIVHQLDAVYSESPKTTDKAVKLARISLNITQDNNFTDEEIDNNLPPELRKDN